MSELDPGLRRLVLPPVRDRAGADDAGGHGAARAPVRTQIRVWGTERRRGPLPARAPRRCGCARSLLGEQGDLLLLSVGRVSPEKRLDVLLDAYGAAAAAPRRARGWRSPATGRPARSSRPRRRAGVRFLGAVDGDALARLYASADVFCFPSTTDTFGQVLLEAGASGLPVVAARTGGTRRARRAPAQRPARRRRTIRTPSPGRSARLATQAERRRELGNQGRIRAAARTSERSFGELWAAYRDARRRASTETPLGPRSLSTTARLLAPSRRSTASRARPACSCPAGAPRRPRTRPACRPAGGRSRRRASVKAAAASTATSAWLDRELRGERRVVLAGHSMGGALAVLAAAERPEAVERLDPDQPRRAAAVEAAAAQRPAVLRPGRPAAVPASGTPRRRSPASPRRRTRRCGWRSRCAALDLSAADGGRSPPPASPVTVVGCATDTLVTADVLPAGGGPARRPLRRARGRGRAHVDVRPLADLPGAARGLGARSTTRAASATLARRRSSRSSVRAAWARQVHVRRGGARTGTAEPELADDLDDRPGTRARTSRRRPPRGRARGPPPAPPVAVQLDRLEQLQVADRAGEAQQELGRTAAPRPLSCMNSRSCSARSSSTASASARSGQRVRSSVTSASISSTPRRRAAATRWWPSITK